MFTKTNRVTLAEKTNEHTSVSITIEFKLYRMYKHCIQLSYICIAVKAYYTTQLSQYSQHNKVLAYYKLKSNVNVTSISITL